MENSERGPKKDIIDVLFECLLFLVVILFIIPLLLIYKFNDLIARVKFGLFKIEQKKNIIFVYSNSPHWKTYIEENYFPLINGRAEILNWSERAAWNENYWPVKAVKHWGGNRDFNPLAIVYKNFFQVKVIRFYSAFNDCKFGKTELLREAEEKFFKAIKHI